MKTIRSFTVLPPDGENYGFPKKFVPAQNGDFYQWLIEQGYPVHKIARATNLQLTNIEYYDGNEAFANEKIV